MALLFIASAAESRVMDVLDLRIVERTIISMAVTARARLGAFLGCWFNGDCACYWELWYFGTRNLQ